MSITRSISVTLPNDLADMVRRKVDSGEYASEGEVILDGLRALQEQDEAIERWLREEVAPTYDAVVSGQSRTTPAETAFDGAAARYARRKRATSKPL